MCEKFKSGLAFYKRCRIVIEPFMLFAVLANSIGLTTIGQYMLHRLAEIHGAINNNASAEAVSAACKSLHKSQQPNPEFQKRLSASQQDASEWAIYIGLGTTIPTILMLLILGRLADRLGHKSVLVINSVVGLLVAIFDTFALFFKLPFWTLLIAAIVYGFSGASMAPLAFGNAYLCDMTDLEDRQIRIAILLFFHSVPTLLFGMVNGYLIKVIGYGYTMIFCSGSAALALLYLVFLVPKTPPLPPSAEEYECLSKPEENADTESPSLWELVTTVYRPVWYVVLPLVIYFLDDSQGASLGSVTMLYVQGYPFCLDPVFLGFYSSLTGIAGFIGVFAAIALLGDKVHPMLLSTLGSISGCVSSVITGVAWSPVFLFISGGIGLVSGICDPVLRTFISLHLPSRMEGTVFAALAIVDAVCELAAQPAFSGIYAVTLRWMRGFVFLITAVLACLCGVLSVVTYLVTRNDTVDTEVVKPPIEQSVSDET